MRVTRRRASPGRRRAAGDAAPSWTQAPRGGGRSVDDFLATDDQADVVVDGVIPGAVLDEAKQISIGFIERGLCDGGNRAEGESSRERIHHLRRLRLLVEAPRTELLAQVTRAARRRALQLLLTRPPRPRRQDQPRRSSSRRLSVPKASVSASARPSGSSVGSSTPAPTASASSPFGTPR